MPLALLIDDDSSERSRLARLARAAGFEVQEAPSLAAARAALSKREPDVAIVARTLPDGGGLDLLGELEAVSSDPEVVLISTDPSADGSGSHLGVHDVLERPVVNDRARIVLVRVAEAVRLKRELGSLRDELRVLGRFGSLTGASPPMQEVYGLVAKVAPTSTTVFLSGERGTGKDLVAATIHAFSRRRDGPFVPFDLAAAEPELAEGELFGREPGRTGTAKDEWRGRFERAGGGTLFLDGISEMPAGVQARLLRALESSTIVRVGGTRPVRVDARVILAASGEATETLRGGGLCEDLLGRLRAATIRLPPLRDRGDDIPLLANHFVRQLSGQHGTERTLAPDALEYLRQLSWPGNVRELKTVLRRAFAISDGNVIGRTAIERLLPPRRTDCGLADDDGPVDVIRLAAGMTIARAERKMILWALREHSGDKRRAARALGISVRTLYNRLKEYGRGAGEDAPAP